MNTAITDKADDGDGVTWLQPTCGTAHFHCRAITRLRGGKVCTLLTSTHELKYLPGKKGRNRILGVQHEPDHDPESRADRRAKRRATLAVTEHP